jgi:hypothetical protein
MSRTQILLAPKDCIKKDMRLSRLDSLGFDVVISIDKGWLEDISQNLSGESSKEDVNGFFTFLGVSCLFVEIFKFCDIFFNFENCILSFLSSIWDHRYLLESWN